MSEQEKYLDPKQQLFIAAKVNRLYEATFDDFDPEVGLPEARAIVEALDPLVAMSSSTQFSHYSKEESDESVAVGDTGLGNFSTKFSQSKERRIKFGVKEYKIGAFVVTKSGFRRNRVLTIEHFWDRGENNEAFEANPPVTEIYYQSETLAISRILKTDGDQVEFLWRINNGDKKGCSWWINYMKTGQPD